MILRSLELTNFGLFNDKSYEFRRGMNLVIGPNEAGKSTMMESVPAIIFGCNEKKRFQPWGQSEPTSAALILENQRNNVLIERNIDTDHIELKQSDDMYQQQDHFIATVTVGEHSPQQLEYREYLAKTLGIHDEMLFRASLFVGQGDFPSSAKQIEQQIRVLLSGFIHGDCDLVRQSLQDDYLAITCEDPWSGLKASPRELDVVKELLGDLDVKREQLDQWLLESKQVQQQISELEQKLDRDRSDYDSGIEYLIWIQQQWHDESDEHQLNTILAASELSQNDNQPLITECKQLEKTLTDAGLPAEIPEDLPRLLSSADDIRCDLVSLQQQIIPLRKELKEITLPCWKKSLLATLLPLLVIVVLWDFFPDKHTLFITLFSILCLTLWGSFLIRYRQQRSSQLQIQKKISQLELRRTEDRSRLEALDEEFESHGLSCSAIELVKMKKTLEVHEHILVRLSEIRHQLHPDGTIDTCQAAKVDPSDCCQQQECGDVGHLTPSDIPQAEEKLADLKNTIHSDEAELLSLLRTEAVLQGRLDDCDKLDVSEGQLRSRAAELEEEKQVLSCAYQVLSEAIDEFHKVNLTKLEKEIGHYLNKATLGKYRSVKIHDDFSVSLAGIGRCSDWVPLANLSRGTIDVACLAIRLAVTRYITHNEYLPFFLDDALVNLDSARLIDTIDALERLSEDHQIIMFTHDERLYKLAGRRRWHVISLGEQPKRKTKKRKENRDHGNELGGQLSLL